MQSIENTSVRHDEPGTSSKSGMRYPGWLTLFIVWTLIGSLAFARHLLDATGSHSNINPIAEFAGWLTCFYPWILLAPLVFRIEKRFPLSGKQWMRSILPLFLCGIFLSFIAVKFTILLGMLVSRKFDLHTLIVAAPLGESGLAFFLYCNIVITGAVIRTLIHLERQQRVAAELELENAKLEACLKDAELEAMRLRLKPHFLFNTLENISALAEDDPRLARKMLARLGELLRAAFRRDYQAEISLSAEIALMNAYLDVERVRFGERLHVSIEIDPQTETALVPSLLLQPLVENAILHGLRDVSGTGRIEVASERNSDHLILTVKDNGNGPSNHSLESLSLGVGLGSTRERLMRMYPQGHQLSVEKMQNGGTLVYIQLPFHTHNAATHDSVANSYHR
ncbi:MAG TPA: histidine kinase [Pseudacidobacterium sp.]|jgi:sensor histidine kinase YesM|nr:histidine kinase [Pseudacidobacterium sp.]